jgi:4-aminobutyrate aminotransferase
MFACEHFDVAPDIMTLAKGLGSGMPIGLVVARRRIMEQWKRGAHGNTYGGNPVCCAAASATVALVEEQYRANAEQMGRYIVNRLQSLQARYPDLIGEVRGRGLMIGVELVTDRLSRRPAKKFTDRLVNEAYRNGLLLLSCGASTLRLMPPLTLGTAMADEALALLDLSIDRTLAASSLID